MCSVGTSPIKPGQEEQSLTPPGKTQAVGTRSPNCGRQQHTVRGKTLPYATGSGTTHQYECEGIFKCSVNMIHHRWYLNVKKNPSLQ